MSANESLPNRVIELLESHGIGAARRGDWVFPKGTVGYPIRARMTPGDRRSNGATVRLDIELVDIYSRRRAGYETGLLKYPADLYEAVCLLLAGLSTIPSEEEVQIDVDSGTFVVARTGVVLAKFPPQPDDSTEGAG